MDPKMGTRALEFIPNTPALVAWGQKSRTSHLSDWINSQTEGNILNSQKRCIANTIQVFIHTGQNEQVSFKYYIFHALIRYETGTLQNTLVVHLGAAVLLALRRPLLDQFHDA